MFPPARVQEQGLLFPALRGVILPFLFLYQQREKLYLSLKEDDFTQTHLSISKKLVLWLGFTETQKDEFELHVNRIDFSVSQLDFQHHGVSIRQFESIKCELDSIARRLLQLDAQLEAAYGKPSHPYPNGFLQNLAQDLRNHQNKLVQRAVNFHRNEADFIENEYTD